MVKVRYSPNSLPHGCHVVIGGVLTGPRCVAFHAPGVES